MRDCHVGEKNIYSSNWKWKAEFLFNDKIIMGYIFQFTYNTRQSNKGWNLSIIIKDVFFENKVLQEAVLYDEWYSLHFA